MKQEPQIILCPYCGHVQTVPENAAVPDQCDECKGLFEPLSRRATQISMGPWFIRDKKNPFRPGCSYEVLSKMARNNRIKPTTVMRGPSTKQFWSVARNVPGIAHLLGYCHQCSAKVSPTDAGCQACNAKFEEPKERNELGLAYRTAQEAASAQRALEKEIAAITGAPVSPGGSGISPAIPASPGAGLLDEVLGSGGPGAKFGGSPLLNFGGSAAATATPPRPPATPMTTAASSPSLAGGTPNFASAFKPSPAAAAAAASRAIDAFSIGDDADDTGVDDVQRKQRTASTMTWALIGFNALLIIVVVVLFLINKGKPATALNSETDTPTSKPPAAATTVASNTATPTPTPTPRPDPVPVVAKPVKKTDPFGAPIVETPVKPAPVQPDPVVAPQPPAASLDRDAMMKKLTEARALLDAQNYAGALVLMRDVSATYPKAWQPEDMELRIAEVAALQEQKATVAQEQRMVSEVASLTADAKAAQAKNDPDTTLKLLAQVRDNYPAKFHPKDLDKAILAALKEVDRKKKGGGKFFGQSTD